MAVLGDAKVNIRGNLAPLRKSLGRARAMVVGSARRMGRALYRGISRGIKRAMSGLKRLARFFTVGVVAAVGASIHAFASFDDAMRRATSVSEVTGEQFAQMADMAKEASKALALSARNTASAFYFLGSAGLSATEQMQSFNAVSKLSKAANISAGESAEIVVDTMKGFGIAFTETQRVTDTMAKAVVNSNMTFAQLGEALSKVSGVSKAAGNSLEDTVALIATLADVGIKGSLSGTNLRMALTRLMKPTTDINRMLKKYNLSLFDSEGEMRSLIDIIGDLGVALEGATGKEKNLAFATMFGKRAVAGQIAIFNKGKEELDNLSESLEDSAGSVDEIIGKLSGLGMEMGQLKQIVINTGRTFGEALGPAVSKAVGFIRDEFQKLTVWLGDNSTAIEAWSTFIVKKAKEAYDGVLGWFSLLKKDQGKAFDKLTKGIKDVFVKGWDIFQEKIAPNIAALGKELGTAIGENILMPMIKAPFQWAKDQTTGILIEAARLTPAAVDINEAQAMARGSANRLNKQLESRPDLKYRSIEEFANRDKVPVAAGTGTDENTKLLQRIAVANERAAEGRADRGF